jgi:hypothetical protein
MTWAESVGVKEIISCPFEWLGFSPGYKDLQHTANNEVCPGCGFVHPELSSPIFLKRQDGYTRNDTEHDVLRK